MVSMYGKYGLDNDIEDLLKGERKSLENHSCLTKVGYISKQGGI